MESDEFLSTAQEFIAQLNGQIKDFTRNGHCSGCGECCSNLLPLAVSEIESIKSYILEHDIRPQHKLAGLCPFLDDDRRCRIYEARPLICKAFKCNRKSPSMKYLKIFLLEHRPCVNVRDTFFRLEAIAWGN